MQSVKDAKGEHDDRQRTVLSMTEDCLKELKALRETTKESNLMFVSL